MFKLFFLKNSTKFLVNFFVIFIISILTVEHYAPLYLHADVLINSVMSLQKLTLFYWGQNRLLNVLPLLTSIFRNPAINLYAVLFFTSLSCYLLFFLSSKIVVALLNAEAKEYLELKIFLAITLIFLAIFNPFGIFLIALEHIEYPLSTLLIMTAFWYGCFKHRGGMPLTLMMISFTFIGIGVNYSVFLFCFSLVLGHIAFIRNLNKKVIFFAWASLISFIAWIIIANVYGSSGSHFSFHLMELNTALPRIVQNLFQLFNLLNLIVILLIFSILHIYFLILKDNLSVLSRKLKFILSASIIFFLLWLLLFASNKWIKLNDYSPRYFTFLFYGLFFYFTIECGRFFILINKKISLISTLTSFILIIAILINTPFISMSKYQIFEKIESITSKYYEFYAGDYWLVWPAVLRTMMHGKTSFGFASRAQDNKINLQKSINKELEANGEYTVLCLRNTPKVCKDQISEILKLPINIKQITLVNNEAHELIISKVRGFEK